MKIRHYQVITVLLILFISLSIILGEYQPTSAQEQQPDIPLNSPHDQPIRDGKHSHRNTGEAAQKEINQSLYEEPGKAPTATGGPDEYGYTWDDGETYSWMDATAGTKSDVEGDDSYSTAIDIGFDFKFYENTYSQLYFNTNGLVSFGTSHSAYYNKSIPDPIQPNNYVATFWDDLCVNYSSYNTGSIYYMQGGTAPNRYFVIEWYEVSKLGYTDLLTFEVILHENGDIVMQYQSLTGVINSATVGIEDIDGIDGLLYLFNSEGLSNNQAIRFIRPTAPTARVKVYPYYQGQFTHAGEVVSLPITIRNIGSNGSDTYDLLAVSTWTVAYYAEDDVTPLTDTDSNGEIDTGPIAQNASSTVMVHITTPGSATVGDANNAEITVRSSLDVSKEKTVYIQTAVPAPFAQVYRDDVDGAMSLYLAQPSAQANKKASVDYKSGSDLSLADTQDGFVYVWYDYEYTGTVYSDVIEYTILDHYGEPIKGVTRLTDHSEATIDTWDYDPSVAVAPNGMIGVLWLRHLSDSNDMENYNLYFSVLDDMGNVVVPETNITNNSLWAENWSDYDIPEFWDNHIAATTDNRFVLTWYQETYTESGYIKDIYYTIRDTDGGILKSITNFTNDVAGGADGYTDPTVTQLNGDRALLAYFNGQDDYINYAVIDSSGATIKTQTSTGEYGWNPDAVQLSNGNIILAMNGSIKYLILDGTYVQMGSATTLHHPDALQGDGYVSVTTDSNGHAILTWMDYSWQPHYNLYYALVDSSGSIITEPIIYLTSQDEEYPFIMTSEKGQGNASYSWTPPSGVDGVAAFRSSPFGAMPGDNAQIKLDYANHGATTGTNATLTLTLDSSLTYYSDTSGITPSISGNDVIWDLPDLAFLDSQDFVIYVEVPVAAYGTIYPVSLEITTDGPEDNPSDNTADAQVMINNLIFLPYTTKSY